MARTLGKLTDITARSAKLKQGRHSDGGGLYLNVSSTGSKSWLFMWVVDGKRREMGMGSYPAVSLAVARSKAADCRTAVQHGRDPIAERNREAEPTFGECADKFLASMQGQWRNEKHRAQWKMTLDEYAASIRPKPVSTIGTDEVLSVLTPIWVTKPETASRLRGRIERVLDFAKVRGWRQGDNPAAWRNHLKGVLPPAKKLSRGHHAAMPYKDVPAFIERLRKAPAMAARALEFLILAASRSGEVYGARWDEIDMAAKVWTVPGPRMKLKKEHRVPLSPRMLDILKPLHEARVSDYVFPGQKRNQPLSIMAMEMLLRRMKLDEFTVHGFRSSFRDWCGDATSFPRELAEQALAHAVGNETERAYRRSDALEARRPLTDAWSSYCDKPAASNVVRLRG